MLFINADAEYREGRAQNYLDPEHIEKIVRAYEAFEDIAGLRRGRDARETLAGNDDNLNIRRYADNAPPPEPHDVRAHLVGGVPLREVDDQAPLLRAHGLDPAVPFTPREDGVYLDFAPTLTDRRDIRRMIESDTGVLCRERELSEAFDDWWDGHRMRIVELPHARNLMGLRTEMLESFTATISPVGLLDSFRVRGAIAAGWGDIMFDLKALMVRGFGGLIDGWVTTIVTGIENETSSTDPLDHKLVKRLLADYLDEIVAVEAEVADLDARIKAAEAIDDENGYAADDERGLYDQDLKIAKSERTVAKKKLKKLKAAFVERLRKAQSQLTGDVARDLVLELLKQDLARQLDLRVASHRDRLVATVENWWNKYAVGLKTVEQEGDAAKATLQNFLVELGYA